MLPVLSVCNVVAPAVPTSPKLIPVALRLQVDKMVALMGKLAVAVPAAAGYVNASINTNATERAQAMLTFIRKFHSARNIRDGRMDSEIGLK